MTGIKPNLSNMHIFGTVCHAHVHISKTKLDARAEKGTFVGYDRSSPAFLVYFPQQSTVKKIRCVKFSERFDIVNEGVEPLALNPVKSGEPASEPEGPEHVENVEGDPNSRYPKRDHVRPNYLDENLDDVNDSTASCIDYCYSITSTPQSYQDALLSPESPQWREAMQEELNALWDNETFELTHLPEGRTLVGGRWVYTIKLGPNGEEKYKARYVAKGNFQVPGVDYHETFSPTARIISIRMLMQLAVQKDMMLHQMDVKTAYLNAPIDCELYMTQPEGYDKVGSNGEKLVCKLRKSLYGLRQSGRNWNDMLHNYFIQEGFLQSQADPCVYTKITETSTVIVFVDDIIITCSSNEYMLKGPGERIFDVEVQNEGPRCIIMVPRYPIQM